MAYSRQGSTIPVILLGGLVYTYWQYIHYILWVLCCLVLIKLAVKGYKISRSVAQHFSFREIDAMDGLDFEQFIANMLWNHGFTGVQLTEKYDLGVDIVAYKDGVKWGIQVKRYRGLVKAEAVRQVVTALNAYGCDRSMVITNSTYSNTARRLAETNRCVLIDRQYLAVLIG